MADELGILGGLAGGSGVGGMLSTIITSVMWIIGGIIFIIILGVGAKAWKNKKAFNIPVTIWIPRSDGKILDEVSAVGGYFKSAPTGGITSFRLKRKGVSTIDIPPPNSRFLVGFSRKLYLIQKGMDDFEPVLPESFRTVETEAKLPDGRMIRKALVNLRCMNQEATAWKFDNEANAKRRFTLWGLWDKYKDIIQMSVFVFIVMLSIYIMWQSMGSLVAQLAKLVETLTKWNSSCGGGVSFS